MSIVIIKLLIKFICDMRLSVIFHIDFLDLYIDYTHAHLKDTSKNLYVSEHNVIKYQVFRIHAVRGKFFAPNLVYAHLIVHLKRYAVRIFLSLIA